ncbi:SDR family oxidoreductase [Kushneria aurantia]|uniref:SDR family oxidoreductase n=1 Tax=Kushneria aurantia TaxID=504092 RepID=A0ABV6G2W5_9GAMM|nr:SDR family oxidoreductase [Kushneria aurantia]
MSKTLVIGANGQIGRRFCQQAAENGESVRAMIRDESQRGFFDALGVECAIGDLTGEMAAAFEGCDAVVFTAGSGPSTGPDRTLMIDLNGALRSVDLAREHGVKRFVMISTLHVDPLQGPEKLKPYLAAKRAADAYLMASSLDWIILRPGRLTDEAGSGRVTFSQAHSPGGEVSRDNVASFARAIVKYPEPEREYTLLDGNTPIAEALAQG